MSIIIKSGASGNLAAVTTDGELSTAADEQVYNGTAWEKAKTANAANGTTGTGVPASGVMGYDGTDYRRLLAGASGDLAVSITNPRAAAAGFYASIGPFGQLQVACDALPLFTDTFEGAGLDTTNKWTTTGSVAPTITNSVLWVNPDVTANATCVVNTQPTFQIATAIEFGMQVSLETTPATGNHRFWGLGVPPSVPGTTAAPLQDAIGFELDTTGVLRASTYSGGTRVFTQTLTRPVDGFPHLYIIVARGDVAFYYIDAVDVPVATSFVGASVKQLPIRVASLNSATVTGTPTMTATGLGLVDPSRGSAAISDGTYPWRKAKVDATGAVTIVPRPADLAVSATASAGSATTATLPAAGAGLFHYITLVEITRYASNNIVGGATPNTITTTNLPGSLAWTCSSAASLGNVTDRLSEDYTGAPLKSTTANTATTIVGPANTNVLWRINVHYFVAP